MTRKLTPQSKIQPHTLVQCGYTIRHDRTIVKKAVNK
jgi:hypothetical protein